MEFLEVSEIIKIHKALINIFGGLHGIRDTSLLESAMAYPQLAYSIGMERDAHMIAAFYCYHLIKNHPFIDGNKRIGSFAMIDFLKINGFQVTLTNNEVVDLAIKTATSNLTERQIQKILKRKSR